MAPETPGSIHEGGELGYSLAHAYGAAFDNPDLIVACVIGDGESETGPLAARWHANKFLNPVTDGAVLPILHLNGYKIANPTDPGPDPAEPSSESLLTGYGYHVHTVEGDDPKLVHEQLAADARRDRRRDPRHPAAGPGRGRHRAAALAGARAAHAQGVDRAEGGGRQAGRGHLAGAPGAASPRPAATPSTWRQLEEWMRSYRPEELFDAAGALRPEIAALAPADYRRMSDNPHANGGLLLRDLDLPRLPATTRSTCPSPGAADAENTRVLGALAAGHHQAQPLDVPAVRPGRDGVQPA